MYENRNKLKYYQMKNNWVNLFYPIFILKKLEN